MVFSLLEAPYIEDTSQSSYMEKWNPELKQLFFWWNILVINIQNAEATLSKFEKQLTNSAQQIWENSEENIQPATLVKVNSTTRGVLGVFQNFRAPIFKKTSLDCF